jgi:hypothetical protein
MEDDQRQLVVLSGSSFDDERELVGDGDRSGRRFDRDVPSD